MLEADRMTDRLIFFMAATYPLSFFLSYFQTSQIERVQNQYLWKNYQIKKCEIDKKNGNRNNERLLFHGTSQESITLINKKGFNRSYAGMHGNVTFKTTLVFLYGARTDLPCHV